jgi:lysophospholipase L1-like esterase
MRAQPLTRPITTQIAAGAALLALAAMPPAQATTQQSPEFAIRVVAFGTSLTARGGWQQALETQLARCLRMKVDVVTLARSGAGSDWGVQSVASVVEADPDVVLIEFSANDAALHRGVGFDKSRDNIRAIVGTIRERRPDARIFLMAMNPAYGWRKLIRPYLDAYYDSYRPLSQELKIGFVDHRPAWKALTETELQSAIPDGVHPDPKVAATLIVPNIVRAVAGSSCEG